MTPITWDIVGLDSNRPLTSGPELFPVGARVCSASATTNVTVSFVWTDGQPLHPYINLRPGSLSSLTFPSIGAGQCHDAYFELKITRSAAAFGQRRQYTIQASDGSTAASTPSPRAIYVERLVSQNRNTTTRIRYGRQSDQSDWAVLGFGGSMSLAVGETYFIELTTQTSTGYEQLQSFITLPNTIFQVLSVSTTYSVLTAPPSRVPVPNPRLWADGCLWDSDLDSPNYNSCLSSGKAGGVVVTIYEVKIISGGGDSLGLEALIYDRSGSSFHYNTDFSQSPGDLETFDPTSSAFSKRFVPDTIGSGGTSRLRFTISNPNPIAISGYNFTDVLPPGLVVASPANASTTCGGTVTAVPGTNGIALAGGSGGANGSCTVLVDVTASATGTYTNISGNLFIDETDTGNNATATLTVSSTAPPVLQCDQNATLALWQFPTGSSATAPLPSSNLVEASAAAGSGLNPQITSENFDSGRSWGSDFINTGPLNTANAEYFEFVIDTTGLDSITLDFAARRTAQGAQNLRLYYGPNAETASTIYSIGSQNTWISQGPTTLSSGLNPAGNTRFRLYAYNSGNNNSGHLVYIDGVRFRGLHCQSVPPPPPTPGISPPTITKSFSPATIGIGHQSTLTFAIHNPNPSTSLSGIAFRDELPSGVAVVAGTFGGTCTGFWNTNPSDGGELVHSGGSLAGGASCTLQVTVTSSIVGSALNVSEPVYATQSGYNNNVTTGIAQAALVVLDSPQIAKRFGPDLVLLGATPGNASTLTFTITNPNAAQGISGVSFSDIFPAGLVVANPTNATASGCGAPTWTPVPGAGSVSFSGGSIAAGGTCTVTVNVTGPAGVYANQSSAVAHVVSGVPASSGTTSSATLVIDQPVPGISLLKEVGPGSHPDDDPWSDYRAVGIGQPVYYKLTVENTGELPLTGLAVSDPNVDTSSCTWPDPLPVADTLDSHIAVCVIGPVSALEGTHPNTATAQANSTSGAVNDTDSARYATVGLAFSKEATPLTYSAPGQIIDYTFTLTNLGAAILPGPVTINDPLVPSASCPALGNVGNLDNFFDPGESIVCSGSYTIQPADIGAGNVTNSAFASVGGFDSPGDSATVNAEATATPTRTATGSPTHTPVDTSTPTRTLTPTPSPTHTPVDTYTETPTETPTRTATHTPEDTPTQTATWTPTLTATQTPAQTHTETPTQTPPDTSTPTGTPAASETAAATPTATATASAGTCGDGTVDAGEQCDLGSNNCAPATCCQSSCNSDCRIIGRCTGNQACCTTEANCPGGQGCCGNAILEAGEQCDDGNRISGDCCSSSCQIEPAPCVPLPDACLDLSSVRYVIDNPKISYMVIKDSPIPDGVLDYWTSRGEFDLPDWIDIDPDTDNVHLIFSGNDGFNFSRKMYHPLIEPQRCPAGVCFRPKADSRGWKRFWKFSLRRTAPDIAGAPGWRIGRIRRSPGLPSLHRYTLLGRNTTVLHPLLDAGTRRVRQSLVIGDVCITRLVDCEPNRTFTRYTCRPAHCGNGRVDRNEQCGEPGLRNCAVGKTCDTCRCVPE